MRWIPVYFDLLVILSKISTKFSKNPGVSLPLKYSSSNILSYGIDSSNISSFSLLVCVYICIFVKFLQAGINFNNRLKVS